MTASGSGTMGFRLAFLHSQGDIDMEVYDANFIRIGKSDSNHDEEHFSFQGVMGQYYYVKVFGYNGATNPTYSLFVDQPEGIPAGGIADQFEENDSFAVAASLPATDQSYSNLTIGTTGDDDYYKIVPTNSGSMTINIGFTNAQGDLDLELYNAAQTRIASSATLNDGESLTAQVTAGQTYFIRVFGFRGATNPTYSMSIAVPPAVGVIPPDSFEDNDTFATAKSINAITQTYSNLTIEKANDDDYYKIVPIASGTMTVSLAFQNAQGNLDLEILNASQGRVGLAATTGNSEQLSFTVVGGQSYYIHAYGFQGATSPNYSMSVAVPAVPVIAADALEQNDTFATAKTLSAVTQTYSNLTIDVSRDDDYYKIVPTTSGTLSVSLAFQHAQGDIDMSILDASQNRLALSDTSANGEQASVAVTAGQAYYVRVYGFQGAVSPNYSMTVSVPGGTAIQPDSLEENDSFAAPRTLTATTQTYSNLTIDKANDDDYYKIVPIASGTMTVSLAFQNTQGNVDLEVLNGGGSRVGLSATTNNAEQLSFTVVGGQSYYVRVFGFQGATSPAYSMSVTVPPVPAIAADALEQNDSFATAKTLSAVTQTYSNLTIDVSRDDDYYKIVPTTSGTLTVSLAFQHAQGDIDMELLNASQQRLAASGSAANGEQVSIAATAGQAYYVRVYGFQGAVSPNYSMTVTVPAAAAAPLSSTTTRTTTSGRRTSTRTTPSSSQTNSSSTLLLPASSSQGSTSTTQSSRSSAASPTISSADHGVWDQVASLDEVLPAPRRRRQ